MRDVFMSYSHVDSQRVRRIVRDLEDHGLSVWLDEIDLLPGDRHHRRIEEGIETSRFFCVALSDAALRSYYVREVGFEQAFSRMTSDRRDSFILPVIVGDLTMQLPLRLSMLFHVDLSRPANYNRNMSKLIRSAKGLPENFTGHRWYKGLNVSNIGLPVGIGSTAQKATLGQSYMMHWQGGIVDRVDVYTNGSLANYKVFRYDSEGRVVENRMFPPDGSGGWSVQEDVWYYTYDSETGTRKTKTMRFDGERTARVVSYDRDGNALEEIVTTDSSGAPDRDYGYTRKVFIRDVDGNLTGEQFFDASGDVVEL